MKKPTLTAIGGTDMPENKDAAAFYQQLEIDTLARTLWGEARGEGTDGMQAVAHVILNRVAVARRHDGKYWWGNNIIQICQKPYQFSCWNRSDPNFKKLQSVDETNLYFATAMRLARRAVIGALSEDITCAATHYHAASIMPYWAKNEQPSAKIGLPILISLISDALNGIDTPITKGAAKALDGVDEAIKAGQITNTQIIEANRHVESLAQLRSEEIRANLSEVNQSLRAEIASEDKYVRRMRPTFGYIMAITWAAQMLGVAYVIMFETAKSVQVLNAMGSLSAIWGVGLSVLGIYVYKRSEDKKAAPPETIFWNPK